MITRENREGEGRMKTIIIASMDRNGVIGRTSKACDPCLGYGKYPADLGGDACDLCKSTGRVPANDVPWSYPEIDEHFDRMTMGHAVIMSRRTWGSLPAKHKGRPNYVVSASLLDHGYAEDASLPTCTSRTLDLALSELRGDHVDRAYVIGGARLYAAALPLADELDLALIDREHEGTVRFPGINLPRDGRGGRVWMYQKEPEEENRLHKFDLVDQRQGSTPELTFTRWVRR